MICALVCPSPFPPSHDNLLLDEDMLRQAPSPSTPDRNPSIEGLPPAHRRRNAEAALQVWRMSLQHRNAVITKRAAELLEVNTTGLTVAIVIRTTLARLNVWIGTAPMSPPSFAKATGTGCLSLVVLMFWRSKGADACPDAAYRCLQTSTLLPSFLVCSVPLKQKSKDIALATSWVWLRISHRAREVRAATAMALSSKSEAVKRLI